MKRLWFWVSIGVLTVAAPGRAADEVFVPGEPPLTRATADRKIDYWEGVFGVRFDDRQRAELRRLQIDEWKLREKEWKQRWVNFLAAVGDGAGDARVAAGTRASALDDLARGDGDAVGLWVLARQPQAAPPGAAANAAAAREAEAMKLAMLKLQFAQRQQFLRDLDAAQARHHELMMLIIRNMAPTPPPGQKP